MFGGVSGRSVCSICKGTGVVDGDEGDYGITARDEMLIDRATMDIE